MFYYWKNEMKFSDIIISWNSNSDYPNFELGVNLEDLEDVVMLAWSFIIFSNSIIVFIGWLTEF